MTGTAADLLNPHIARPLTDRDAVVARLYAATRDGHAARHLDMDAVCVGAVTGRNDLRALHCHAVTPKNGYVEALAVRRRQAANKNVL